MQHPINRVVGAEPKTPDSSPTIMSLGNGGVHRIAEETENHGTYGITWFVGYNHQGHVVMKMNALNVGHVSYGPPL